jgi:L-2,4-diaminobutyrate decarboxylase
LFESEFLSSSAESQRIYQHLISRAAQLVAQALPPEPYPGKTPAELSSLIEPDFLSDVPRSSDPLLATLQAVIANSVNVNHPHTAAHLHCPPLLASLAAEVVISALNQSMDSFDQAPIATVIEQRTLQWLYDEVSFPPAAGGTFTTGGSQSNYLGLLLARDAFLQKHWNWNAQTSGLPPDARRLRILCSEAAHFTVEKSAAQLGLGTNAVVRIAVDEYFRMDPMAARSALQSLKAQSLFPMAIVATAGTTDFGSIDPLLEIADLSREEGAWLHVDAAYGGALLFSPQHRHRIAGIEAADSLAIDFHKLFWQPIPCSVFLLREARNFNFIKMHADYLNPETLEEEGVPNLVTNSLLTSRRFDALKLWMSLQSLGRAKLAAMIDRTIALAAHAAKTLRTIPEFELLCEPQLSTVVFRFVPSAADIDADKINFQIRKCLFESGRGVIGHTRARSRQCLKFTLMNPSTTETQVETLVQAVLEEGRACENEIAK